jgi:spermidine synthase
MHHGTAVLVCSSGQMARIESSTVKSLLPQLCSNITHMPCAAGGEGATAREVLRHKSVEKVVMVDIDKVGRLATNSSHRG